MKKNTYPRTIRFTPEELARIERALLEKISKDGRRYTFSEFIRDVIFKGIEQNVTIQVNAVPVSEQDWQKIVEENIIPALHVAADRNIV